MLGLPIGLPVRRKHKREQAALNAGCQRKPLKTAIVLEMPGSPTPKPSNAQAFKRPSLYKSNENRNLLACPVASEG
jgi:hypothetical protein